MRFAVRSSVGVRAIGKRTRLWTEGDGWDVCKWVRRERGGGLRVGVVQAGRRRARWGGGSWASRTKRTVGSGAFARCAMPACKAGRATALAAWGASCSSSSKPGRCAVAAAAVLGMQVAVLRRGVVRRRQAGTPTASTDLVRLARLRQPRPYVPSGACTFVKGFNGIKRRGARLAGAGGGGGLAREPTAAEGGRGRRRGAAAGRQRCGRVPRVWASAGGERTSGRRGGGVARAKDRRALSKANRQRRRMSNGVSCIVASTPEGSSTRACPRAAATAAIDRQR